MDRRQRKTREAIFKAFTTLLAQKDFAQITVGEIIDLADVGRATFYAHFETKDYLLKEFCRELFCHIFDTESKENCEHKHIFHCESNDAAFIHLIEHLQKNDNNILFLLSSRNNAMFLKYFRKELDQMIERQLPLLETKKSREVPDSFWKNYVASTFAETLKWWIDNGMKESPDIIVKYFYEVL